MGAGPTQYPAFGILMNRKKEDEDVYDYWLFPAGGPNALGSKTV